jgi:hypothetical protein
MSTTPTVGAASIARPATFRQRYCRTHGLAETSFELRFIRRCLPAHAHLFYWLFALGGNFRAADLEFVRALGDLRYLGSFNDEAHDFVRHPGNRVFSRRFLGLRVSVARARRLFVAVMQSAGSPTGRSSNRPEMPGVRPG